MQSRTAKLIGSEGCDKLNKSCVCVVGVGGVGGYISEILARSGIGRLILMDGDKISESNKNRQIIALTSTIGRYKSEVMAERARDINPLAEVISLPLRYNAGDIEAISSFSPDYVVDAIDSLESKTDLICACHDKGIPIISAMGAGGRAKLAAYEIIKLDKTGYDPLAKKLRKMIKDRGAYSIDVCCTREPCIPQCGEIGSIAYNPAVCGITVAAHVIERLIGIKT